MARDREVACIYYINEGNCSKGREGTFRHACQTCSKYQALKGGHPRRKNLKHKKLEKAKRRSLDESNY